MRTLFGNIVLVDPPDASLRGYCWLYKPHLSKPYAQQRIAGRVTRLTRFVRWLLGHGPEKGGNSEVHHLCGRTKCINPEHLVVVSPTEHKCVHSLLTGNLDKGSRTRLVRWLGIKRGDLAVHPPQTQGRPAT
jgi:hypothetical protein